MFSTAQHDIPIYQGQQYCLKTKNELNYSLHSVRKFIDPQKIGSNLTDVFQFITNTNGPAFNLEIATKRAHYKSTIFLTVRPINA